MVDMKGDADFVKEGFAPATVAFLDTSEIIVSGLGMGTHYTVQADPESGTKHLAVEHDFPTAGLARSLAADTREDGLAAQLITRWEAAHPDVPVRVGDKLAADATPTGTPQGFFFGAYTPAGEPLLERRRAWSADRPYLGRSMSKAYAAITVLALQDRGKLAVDDPVSRFLPEFGEGPLADVTLRMLLIHTAGLPFFLANEGDGSPPALTDPHMPLREAAAQIAAIPLVCAPGAEFHYTELGYQVAGAVAEVASGMLWPELFADTVAGPLELCNTRWFNNFSNEEGVANPIVAVGAVSCIADLTKVGLMVLSGGAHTRADGSKVQVLSQAAVDELTSYQPVGDTSKCQIFKMLKFTKLTAKGMQQEGLISAQEVAVAGTVWSKVGYGLGAWLGTEPDSEQRHVMFMGAYTSAMCLMGLNSPSPLLTIHMSYTRFNPVHGVLAGLCWEHWSRHGQGDAE